MARPNWANRTLCHGDNLEFLRSMNSNTVHLIATDPPFNKGRDFHATPDSVAKGASFQDRWSWDRDVHESWVDKITDDFPKVMNVINGSRESYGDDMGAFLCFMGVRILEMHRVLRNDGSMYLHCDDTASHYLKELMDSIFGRDNFKNEIVWRRTSNTHNDGKRYGRITDRILFYTKGKKYTWNKPYAQYSDEYLSKMYRYNDSNGRYRGVLLTAEGLSGGGYTYEFYGHTRVWKFPKTTMAKLELEGMIIPPKKKGGLPQKKHYLDMNKGVPLQDNWVDVERVSGKERTDYPTQKPLELYERLIKASSNEGDVILDPFCGCATTCVAAEKLQRKWIGIDIWDKAHKIVMERLKKEGFLAGPKDKRQDLIVTKGKITYAKKPLKRTDGGSEAVPFMETKLKQFDDRESDPHSNKEKKCMLVEQCGPCCQGCGIELHERYLELDHKEPRSAGGSNLLRNRILLCGPCNKLKRDLYTLVWLRQQNTKLGYMINEKALSSLKN